MTYTLAATVSASATGALVNTATVVSAGVSDPDLANNTATDTDTLTPEADLSVTKTDGQTAAVPGQAVTYTIVVSNTGPSSVSGATVADTLPASLVNATWTCSASAGSSCTASGSGSINDTVDLLAGGTATYTLTATVSAGATGTLANTATVASAGVSDPDLANNTATDTDTLTPEADLSVTKTDGQTAAVPGEAVTYTIVVSSAGPSSVSGATVTDTLPASLQSATWTCSASAGSSCTASGSGSINDTVDLLAGGTATYTLTATVSAGATGTLANTATVASAGVSDPDLANNTATDTDTLTPEADLSVTKTDGQTAAVPGEAVTYTIVVSNTGPSSVTGATVADTLPASLVNATWTCSASAGSSCAASGSGSINDTVDLLADGSATYTLTATVSAGATGTLVNTATVVSAGVSDPDLANNTATDTDTLTPEADLSVTKTDGQTAAVPGEAVTYTIVVSSAGPSSVSGATVTDTLPASLQSATWTCSASAGSSCTASGSGSINDTVDLLANGSATYTLTATVSAGATGTLANTATVASLGASDPDLANNTATDTDTLTPEADLSVTKSDGQTAAVPGQAVTYTIVVSNTGPSSVTAATVTDTLPASLQSATWTCSASAGSSCTASGSGSINDTVDVLAGGSATYTLTATVSAGATGTLVNTATVVSAGVSDPDLANNTATDTDSLTPEADLSVAKTDGQTAAVPGQSITYTITVGNAGPSSVTAATVADTLPAALQNATWTCSASAGSSCAASGSGSINDTVDLPASGSVTYTLAATVSASATGTLVNTATVVSAGVSDPDLANNTATDTDTLTPEADLSVTKTDGQTVVVPGQSITYTITVGNAGPSSVTGATVTDTLPAALQSATWTCTASSGSSCTASGAGSIGDTVDLLAGGSATYSLTATVSATATGTLVNTASVAAPGTVSDPNSANDSAQDVDTAVNPLDPEGELSHGFRLVADLASLGVNADEDRFPIHQDPFASYEVMVDAASGDFGANGVVLERMAADGVTVLQTSQAVGLGSARTLRFMNTTSAPIDDQWIRVRSGGCASDCGTDDTYRIRAWETTGRLPRFNNTASQITILLVQNPTMETISGRAYFWSAAGALVAEHAFTLAAHQLLVLNTATIPGALSGTATVVHDGPYGVFVGKAVALEPATGFSFDSPLATRPR